MKNNKSWNKTAVLVTGATGFVGKQLVQQLNVSREYAVCLAVRPTSTVIFNGRNEVVFIPDISAMTDWTPALSNCDVVIHTAARVHIMKESSENSLFEYRKINVDGTMNLARQAAQQGVRRFIFISSIKVNGEETQSGCSYRPDDPPSPQDPYAISKAEAEFALMALSVKTGMEIVVIRPTLIYGPGVKGNFLHMISWLQKGYPLPLKSINNKRSLVSVYNLVDLIIRCINHPRAANQIFLVSDGDDISISELLILTGNALNRKVRLIPISSWVLRGVGKITGKQRIFQRLCGSLQVDISKTSELLDWLPPIGIVESLQRTVSHKED